MELMLRRRELMAMQSELPSAYRKVEYLQSDGNQYITTNVIPSNTDVIIAKAQFVNTIGVQAIVGSTNNQTFNAFGVSTSMTGFYAQTAQRNYRSTLMSKDTNVHTHILDFSRMVYSVDDETVSLQELVLTVSPVSYGLLHQNGGTQYPGRANARLYYVKISNRANFIPCVRKSDSKPGMYDTVSKTFYTNAGSGEFDIPT